MIRFQKMSGAGNDFIVIDNRGGIIAEEGRRGLFEPWCRRRTGIGADGVLLVEPSPGDGFDFRMRYYNADGGEAEMCGNGARCIARFAFGIGAAPQKMRFMTMAGPAEAQVTDEGEVILSVGNPKDLCRGIDLSRCGAGHLKGDFINTGVPHVVIRVNDLKNVPVFQLGRAVRNYDAFAPAGTNVNFYKMRDDGGIDYRTYERGVEDETLACGTGAIATALIASLAGLAQSPTEVHTSGGPVLRIYFEKNGDGFTNIRLEGEAQFTFTGEVE
ncbi:diaminopimelate epimerase [bacterium]|nr:diaminopimelate epimerase [bacterium]